MTKRLIYFGAVAIAFFVMTACSGGGGIPPGGVGPTIEPSVIPPATVGTPTQFP